jgi:hypothetical protein
VSPDAWLRLLYRAGRKHDLSLIFYGNGETKFPEMADFSRLPALQKLSSRLEMV